MERKYLVRPGVEDFVLAWLRHSAIPDNKYPANRVYTVYFDTPDLDAYEESVEGDVSKQKARLRWYADLPPTEEPALRVGPGLGTVLVFAEVKSKDGWTTMKTRHAREVPPSAIREGSSAYVFDQLDVRRTFFELGHSFAPLLRPLLFNVYTRHRFIDPVSRTKINLDQDIRSAFVADFAGTGRLRRPETRFPSSVLELKSEGLEVPVWLIFLKKYLSTWTAFSKYGATLERHLSTSWQVAWPSPGHGPREFQVSKTEDTYGLARRARASAL